MKTALALTVALFSGALAAPAVAQMSPPPAMTSAQLDAAAAGNALHFVVRVDRVSRSTVSAHVLDPITDSRYAATGDAIAIYAPDAVPIVMGTRDDLKPGSILYVYATATKPHNADATKLVVVTPYVTVK